MRALAAATCFALLAASAGSAAACSCWHPHPGDKDYDAYMKDRKAWRLAQAADVVRGQIVDVRKLDKDAKTGAPLVIGSTVLATLKVTSTVKGNLALKDLTLVTNAYPTACGVGPWVEKMVASKREVTVGVTRTSSIHGAENAYLIGSCGYVSDE